MTRIAITAGATAGNGRRAATHYGPRGIEDVAGTTYADGQGTSVQVTTFNFDDLPVSGVDLIIPRIPANATLLSANIEVLAAMTGTTGTMTLGLEQPDGTVIDADGVDVAVAQAVLVAGARVPADGALIGKTIGANQGQLVVTTGGTVTGGKFQVELVYAAEYDRAAS